MVHARFGEAMMMGGTESPCAFVEVQNIGELNGETLVALSKAMADAVSRSVGYMIAMYFLLC
jgi:hypothetical protein